MRYFFLLLTFFFVLPLFSQDPPARGAAGRNKTGHRNRLPGALRRYWRRAGPGNPIKGGPGAAGRAGVDWSGV